MQPGETNPLDTDPFANLLGIEIIEADDGYARARLPLRSELSSSTETMIAHGGVSCAFADHTAAAAIVSVDGWPAPTIDIRLDYLRPVTDDLEGEAEIVRQGGTVATVDVELATASDGTVAVGRGVYKLGSNSGQNAWHSE